MTDEELIAQMLAEQRNLIDCTFYCIEELDAKLAKALESSEQGWATAKAAVDCGMALERKLNKAVEALRWYDDRFTDRKARDTLVELEEEG